MRILVTGAYGLIGGYVVSHLIGTGHSVLGAGRDIAAAKRRFPDADWLQVDLAGASADQWVAHLAGIDAVVNCAGVLQDSPRDNTVAVHVEGLARLTEACARAGVSRFIQVSAAGVGPDHASPFNDTKHQAERILQESGLDWVILRPGLVLAPAAYGGTALLRGLAGFPLVTPTVWGGSPVQVVSAQDVAAAVGGSLAPTSPRRAVIDLCHEQEIALRDLVVELRRWLGLPPAPIWSAPSWIGALAGKAADALALLGWRSPMRTEALTQLRRGVRGDSAEAARLLGRPLLSLRQMLAGWPSGVQERWFARAYFLKPLALGVLAAFWLASGVVGLTAGRDPAVAVLTVAGVPMGLAAFAVLAGSIVDIALGLAVCVRRTARPALLGMLLTTLAYLGAGSLLRPDLWLDPLGPFVKSIPAAVLALAALALMDER